jgi:hypothetical protein
MSWPSYGYKFDNDIMVNESRDNGAYETAMKSLRHPHLFKVRFARSPHITATSFGARGETVTKIHSALVQTTERSLQYIGAERDFGTIGRGRLN